MSAHLGLHRFSRAIAAARAMTSACRLSHAQVAHRMSSQRSFSLAHSSSFIASPFRAVPVAYRDVRPADSPEMGGAVLRAQHQS